MLPTSTILGNLHIIEIYEFYNKPVLFACKNNSGHIYMAVWIDEKEGRDSWLYAPLSETRFGQVRNGKIDLHDTFTRSEDEIVLEVIVYKSHARMAEIKLIATSELDESLVPLPDDYLDVPDSLPPIVWENVDQRHLQEKTHAKLIEA